MATDPSTVDLHGCATNGRITQTAHNPDNAGAAGNYQGCDGVCKLIGYPLAARAVG